MNQYYLKAANNHAEEALRQFNRGDILLAIISFERSAHYALAALDRTEE